MGYRTNERRRTHGASITPEDFRHVMKRFERHPGSDPFAVSDCLASFLGSVARISRKT